MKILERLAELRFRNNILYRVGLINFILALLLVVPLLVDDRLVLGINPWIKPIKFCISLWIYLWTFGWIMWDLQKGKKWIKKISFIIAVSMMLEICIIVYQAARATQSHFNMSSLFDGVLFGAMGVLVGINTVCVIVVAIMFLFQKSKLDGAYLLALRLALIIFILGNWVGGVMISNGAHAVGVQDGGLGLAFVNWSTEGGDLRVAHFLGLHALQLIPLPAHFLKNNTPFDLRVRSFIAAAWAIIFAGFVAYLYQQAMDGIPFIFAN